MCVYCNCGDHAFRFDPPWWDHDRMLPQIPKPIHPGPYTPWPLDRLRDYHELLKRIKALEDALGCPCEPNKADYIGLFEERIKELEKQVGKKFDGR